MSNSGDFSELLETVRLGVLRGERRHETIVYGHVTAYDSQHNSVKVKIYPGTDDGGGKILETEYMPLFTPWSGAGWGFQAGPILDQMTQCAVHILEEGDGTHFVYATFFHDQHQAPGAPAKELWIVHEQKGTFIKLQNDSSLREGGQVRISLIGPRTQSISSAPSPISGVPAINSALAAVPSQPQILALSPTLQANVGMVVGALQGAVSSAIQQGQQLQTYLNTALSGQSVSSLLAGTPLDSINNAVTQALGSFAPLTTGLGTSLSGEDLDSTHKVVRCSDLNKFIMDYNNHTHTDPQGGVTGKPVSQEPLATCSITMYAQ